MDKKFFIDLCNLLRQDEVFMRPENSVGRPQTPVEIQLLAFLVRLGSTEYLHSVAMKFGTGKGAVPTAFNRLLEAIPRVLRDRIQWPDEARRRAIREGFRGKRSLGGAVGAVDGTHILWAQKPYADKNPGELFNYKNRWSLNVMVIADHEKNIIDFELGFSGACHDSFVMRHSNFFENRSGRFSPDEYILGDSGYFVDKNIMVPFRDSELVSLGHTHFNRALSRGRVIIENTFADLKNRFPRLRALNFQDRTTAIQTVFCCLLLHNFLNRRDVPNFVNPPLHARTQRILTLINAADAAANPNANVEANTFALFIAFLLGLVSG